MQFLSARWQHLLLANYSISPETIADLVPPGTSLDRFAGHTFVSLVAFLFDDTRVLGIPTPFHRQFEEVNLRFYVTPIDDPTIRAVSFIQEIVPKRLIPLIANGLFHENYVALPMTHHCDPPTITYTWGKDATHHFTARLEQIPTLPEPGSIGEFITEHYWGYARTGSTSLEYQVQHPQWECCDVTDFDISIDFATVYGERFECLNHMQPHCVQYAVGSEVTVSFPRRLNPRQRPPQTNPQRSGATSAQA